MNGFVNSFFPEGFHIMDVMPTLGFVIAVVAVVGVLIRLIADKASRYNHALASALAILFIYLVLMMLHGKSPANFVKDMLNCLPLIDYDGRNIILFQFGDGNAVAFFREFLLAFILSFILIGLDDLIPDAKNRAAWIVVQIFIAATAFFLYSYAVKAIEVFAPDMLDSYVPLIIGCILLFMVLLGILKVIFSLLLVAVSPLLGAISLFFGSAPMGKVLGKATLCAIVLCAVTVFMSTSGYGTIPVANVTVAVGFLPTLVLLGLWFLMGCIL